MKSVQDELSEVKQVTIIDRQEENLMMKKVLEVKSILNVVIILIQRKTYSCKILDVNYVSNYFEIHLTFPVPILENAISLQYLLYKTIFKTYLTFFIVTELIF